MPMAAKVKPKPTIKSFRKDCLIQVKHSLVANRLRRLLVTTELINGHIRVASPRGFAAGGNAFVLPFEEAAWKTERNLAIDYSAAG
jgi:hypothetical protein